MKLSEYLAITLPIIGPKMHQQTVYKHRRAVRRYCEWIGSDVELELITPETIYQFGHAVDGYLDLASNLRSIMRTYDKELFPAHQKKYRDYGRGDIPVGEPSAPTSPHRCKSLQQFVEWYIADRDPRSTQYRQTLRRRGYLLQLMAPNRTIRQTLTEDNVNRLLQGIDAKPHTVNKYRQDILAIWRAAADEDLATYPNARRIKRIKCPPQIVNCYTVDEIARLVKAARKYKGRIPSSQLLRETYWPAIIMAAWDSGLRRGDLWRVNTSDIRVDGTALVLQNKTQKIVPCRFRPETIAAIKAAGGTLAWPYTERSFSRQFQAIVDLAGVTPGSFKWLRRASGSYVEVDHPGAGSKHLGNTPQVFSAHYDARLSNAAAPLPPALLLT